MVLQKEIKQNKGIGSVYIAHMRMVGAGLREEVTLNRDMNQIRKTMRVWSREDELSRQRNGSCGGPEAVSSCCC